MLAALVGLQQAAPAGAAGSGTVSAKGTLGNGYFFVATDGGIFNFGDSEFKGSTGDIKLNKPIVGAAATPTGEGYWLVASDGGIFTFGDAEFLGSEGGGPLNSPIVAMASTRTGKGYWLFAADGGVFTHGDAEFFGSEGGGPLNKPIVGADVTPSGKGYYLVASDGGIFTHGDAEFYGSEGGTKLNKPIVGMTATQDGKGYYLVATDGGIFTHGKTTEDAPFFGSQGGSPLNAPIVGMDLSASNQGYYLVAADGGIFAFGDAVFLGSSGDIKLNKPIVGMAVTPNSPITAPDFRVNLRGSSEVPGPGDPDAKAAVANIDVSNDETPEACFNVRIDNVSQTTAMHIHKGVAGASGPVVVDLGNLDFSISSATAAGCVAIAKDLADDLLANPQGYYLNVHTTEYPSGAARGQLRGETGIAVAQAAGATTAQALLFDTENPTAAVVFKTIDTQGAPVIGFDFDPGTKTSYYLLQSGGNTAVLAKSDIAGTTTTIGTVTWTNAASAFGFDFNPVSGLLRVTTNAGETFLVAPATGAVTADAMLSFAPGDPLAGTGTPTPAGAAYTNNVAGATTTSLYDVDYGRNVLLLQNEATNTVSTVGGLGVTLTANYGFDVSGHGTPLLVGQLAGAPSTASSAILAVNLTNGATTNLGIIGDGSYKVVAYSSFT
jgi:hypothetical protein